MSTRKQPHRKPGIRSGAVRTQEISTMATKQQDAIAFLEFAKRAYAPTARFNELVVRNFEQAARFQYEVAGDVIQATIDQLNAAASTQDFGTLASRQAEIVNGMADKASKRSHELVKLATETQAQFASWVEDAVQVARKAA
jgi:phasin family protein